MRWGVTALTALSLAAVLSLRPIRQRFFEFFLVSHIILIWFGLYLLVLPFPANNSPQHIYRRGSYSRGVPRVREFSPIISSRVVVDKCYWQQLRGLFLARTDCLGPGQVPSLLSHLMEQPYLAPSVLSHSSCFN